MNLKDVQWLLNAIICCAIPSILGFIRTNQCYSCMSPEYETLFREGHFAKYFYEPKNFSAQCNHPMNPHNMGSVACRTICLTLIQDLIVMGRATGKRLTMRGCSTTLNRFGFVNRTMQIFDRYDMCREVKMSDLFNYDTDSQVVTVCSCLGDKCNGILNSSPPKTASSFLFLSSVIFFISKMLKF